MRDIITKILLNRYIILFTLVGFFILMLILNGLNNMLLSSGNADDNANTIVQSEVATDKLSVKTDDGSSIKKQDAIENEDIIESFIKSCNDGDVASAYNMLSEDCKELIYPSQETFANEYRNLYFDTKRECGKDLAYNGEDTEIYRIQLYKSSIETGEIDTSPISDYYTIIKDENGNKKLNINRYIKTEYTDKSEEYKGIKIRLTRRDIYFDEEYCTFMVENSTSNSISLRTGDSLKTIYMVANNLTTYVAPGNEINDLTSMVEAKQNKEVRIRFNKGYRGMDDITAIVFSDIVPDYKTFSTDPKNLKSIYTIKIKL